MSPHPPDKAHCRRLGRTARLSVPDGARAGLAASAGVRLLDLPELAAIGLVLAYGASADEIDPHPAIALLRQRGCAIAYPRLAATGRLTFHLVEDDSSLVYHPSGILEAPPTAHEITAAKIEVVIVPGVAFDTSCRRVGRGSGHYDRALAAMPHALTIGYAFDCQVLDAVPSDEHDIVLSALVTPTRTFRAAP